jgi:hypothetical protein
MAAAPRRALSAVVVAAILLAVSACEKTGRPAGPSPEWQMQQYMERGHYG